MRKPYVVRYGKTADWRLGIGIRPAEWSLYRIGTLVTFYFGRVEWRLIVGKPEPAYTALVAARSDAGS